MNTIIELGKITHQTVRDLGKQRIALLENGADSQIAWSIRLMQKQIMREWRQGLQRCDYLLQALSEVQYLRENGYRDFLNLEEDGGYHSHSTSGILIIRTGHDSNPHWDYSDATWAKADGHYIGSLVDRVVAKDMDTAMSVLLDKLEAVLQDRIKKRDSRIKGEWAVTRKQEIDFLTLMEREIDEEEVPLEAPKAPLRGQKTFGRGVWLLTKQEQAMDLFD